MVTSVTSPTVFNTSQSANERVIGAVKQADGNTMVFYQGYTSLDGNGMLTGGVYGRVISAAGVPTGVEITVAAPPVPSGYVAFDPSASEVFALPDGTFALVYNSNLSGATGTAADFSVYVQRYSASGSLLGSAVEIGPANGSNFVRQGASRPDGGFDVIVDNMVSFPPTQFQVAFNASGIVTSSTPTSPNFDDIAYGSSGNSVRIFTTTTNTGSPPFNATNTTEVGLDLNFSGVGAPVHIGVAPPAGLTSTNFVFFSTAKVVLDGAGTAYVAAYFDVLDTSVPSVITYVSEQVRLYKVTPQGSVTLLNTINGPVGNANTNFISVTDLAVLADGSVVIGLQQLDNNVSNGFIRHISSTGALVNPDVNLGFSGGQDIGPQLIKLTDGSIGAVFAATDSASDANGTDVYIQKFSTGTTSMSVVSITPFFSGSATGPGTIVEGNVGAFPILAGITRTGDLSLTGTVDWAVTGAGGLNASDFTGGVFPSGTMTFMAGMPTPMLPIMFSLVNDTIIELDETFTFTLSNPTGGLSLGVASTSVTILNDDGTTYLAVSTTDVSKIEGNSGAVTYTYTVNRTGDTTGVTTVDWSVGNANGITAGVNGADFAGGNLPSGSLTFAAGELTKTITVNAQSDTSVEANETFVLTLSNANFGAGIIGRTVTSAIVNDDGAILSIAALSADKLEGSSGTTPYTFTVTRGGDTSIAASATWTVASAILGNPAVTGADFAGGAFPTGTVNFLAGETSKVITFNVQGDTTLELDEAIRVALSSPSSGASIGTIGFADGNIRTDDTAISHNILATGADKFEGNSGATAFTFTVTRNGDIVGASSIDWAVTAAGAAEFVGGVLPTGTVNFAAGETLKQITINVAGDTNVEGDNTFTVSLSNFVSAVAVNPPVLSPFNTLTAQGIIRNDDGLSGSTAILSIAPLSADQAEGNTGNTTPFTFTVTRSGDTSGVSTANWAVQSVNGGVADFVGAAIHPSGTVNFTAGETSKVITVNVQGDTAFEPDATFFVQLSNTSIGTVLANANATGIIRNDDTAPVTLSTLNIAPTSADKAEGNSGTTTAFTFTVTRTGATTGVTTADWAVSGASVNAADFGAATLPSGTVTFAAGETTRIITVNVLGDTVFEGDELLNIMMSNPSANTIFGTPIASGNIRNDDVAAGPATLSIAATSADKLEGSSGSTAFTFTVTRTGDTSGASSALWVVGGNVLANDFAGSPNSGTVNFAAGETSKLITLNVAGDTVAEFDEAFTVTLANPGANTIIGTATANGNIRNDDAGAVAMPILTKLVDAPNLFQENGFNWFRSQRAAWNGDPIYIDQRTSASTFANNGANAVDLVVVGTDRFGDVSNNRSVVATYTTALTVNNSEVSDKGVVFFTQPTSVVNSPILGSVIWAQQTAGTPGSFDIKFRGLGFSPNNIASDTGFADITLAPSTITIKSSIANYAYMDWDWISGANPYLAVGHVTRAAGALTTQDAFYQVYDANGVAVSPQIQVGTAMRGGAPISISTNGSAFLITQEKITSGVASVEFRTFAPTTGALGAVSSLTTNFAFLYSVYAFAQNDGTFDVIVDGKTAGNARALNIYQTDANFAVIGAPVSIPLVNANGVRHTIQRISNDSLVIAYTDNNQVHIALINAAGVLLEDTVIPGITNFDRIRSIGQNQIELTWRETIVGNENVVKMAVYDLNTAARVVDNSAATTPQYLLGSHFADNLKSGSANDIIKGYAGNDIIDGGAGKDEVEYTGNKSDYTLTKNLNGSWTVTVIRGGSPDGTDTLTNVEQVDFADGQKQLIEAQATQVNDLGALFKTGNVAFAGQVWSRPQRAAWNGDPILIGAYSPTAGYVAGGPNVQNIVVTGQDRFGDTENITGIATYTSKKTVNNTEVLDKGVVLYSLQSAANYVVNGAAFWMQPSGGFGGPAGFFDIVLQGITFTPPNLAYNNNTPTINIVGGSQLVASTIADFKSLDWALNGDKILFAYSTQGAGATTQSITALGYDPLAGAATGPVTTIATIPSAALWLLSGTSINDGNFFVFTEDNTNAVAAIKVYPYAPVTGVVGAPATLPTKNLGNIINFLEIKQTDGASLFVVEGTELGTNKHMLQFIRTNTNFVPINDATNIELNSPANLARLQLQTLGNGLNVVGYTDNAQVHIALIDPFGNVVSNTIVPNLTGFDRLRSVGQNQFELIWRETVSGVENVVKGAMFDANDVARVFNQFGSTNGQWVLGTTQADTLTGGSGADIFKGYGGNDIITGNGGNDEADYTGVRSDYTVTNNNNGSWTVTDNRVGSPDGTDTLSGIEKLQFKDQLLNLAPLGATPIVPLAEIGALFSNAGGIITGQHWGRVNRSAFNGDPLLINNYTPAAGYIAGGPNPQTLVVTGQDRFGETEKFTLTLATYTSAQTVNGIEMLAKGVVLFNQPSSATYTINGAAFWATRSQTGPSGTFDVNFQGLQFRPGNLVNDVNASSITFIGAGKSLFTNVANFDSLDWDWFGTTLVAGYSTRALNATTRDYFYQGFDATGTAIGSLINVATLDADAKANVTELSATEFAFFSENNMAAIATLDIRKFNPVTGVVTAPVSLFTGLTDIQLISEAPQADGSWMFFLNGTEVLTGKHVIKVIKTTGAFVPAGDIATLNLTDAAPTVLQQHQTLGNGFNVLAYTLYNEVHVTLINAAGGFDSTYIVPGITTFDRIRSLGNNQFEIMYRETVAGNENVVKGTIFDVNIGPRVINASAATNGQWVVGSELGDTLTGSAFNDTFKGYSGDDIIDGLGGVNQMKYTGASTDYTITKNGNGTWTITDNRGGTADGSDTLRNIQVLDFADKRVALGLSATNDAPATLGGVATGNVLTNDTGPDNDAIIVGTVNGLPSGVGISIAGMWGNLTLNANGAYTYTITNAGGATGSHLHDIFTYTAFDAKIAGVWGTTLASAAATLDITLNRAVEITAGPIVTPPHRAVSVAAGSLFSATDHDGDAIQKYQFFDDSSEATSGNLAVNGVVKAAGIAFEVTAAELAQTTYRPGSTNDSLFVRANDGFEWSPWKAFTATPTPESAPVVSVVGAVGATSISPGHFEVSRLANGIFNTADADGDAIVRYEVWDGTADPESGKWALNNVDLLAQQANEVSAADIANLTFKFGTVADSLFVRAYDGVLWSAWKPITVNGLPNAVPVLTGAAIVNPAHGSTSLQAATLFAATDPDGDTITKYQFFDGNIEATSGKFKLNGVAQNALQNIDVTAAGLATATFDLGSTPDSIFVRANDGFGWSAWKNITVNAPPNVAPIVTGLTVNPAHAATSIAASTLFTVADAENDAITKYQFFDATPDIGSGLLKLNGFDQAPMQSIEVAAADLGTATWAPGSISDLLYVRAFDGLAWSGWALSTINPPLNAVPVVTNVSANPVHAATAFAATALFTASDGDNDAITKYQFYDGTSDVASGSLKVNGITQASMQAIEVSAANIGNAIWNFGTVSDDLYVRVYDGLAWSPWKLGTVNAPPNAVPVVSGNTVNPAHGATSLAASSLFTVTDADAVDTMTKYQFWDGTADTASGNFKLFGVDQAAGQAIDVTAANLANTTWSPGSIADEVYIRAFDGYAWSNWKTIGINAPPNTAPVVNGSVFTPNHNATSLVPTALFSVTDAESDAITKYRFWDGTPDSGSGVFKISGVTQAAGQTIEVTAAHIGLAAWVPGTISDQIFVQAYDGFAWSAWKSITVNPAPNAVPVVTAPSAAVAHGTLIQAQNMFSVIDPDNDFITQYQVWDGNAAADSGYWKVNGIAQGANQAIDVTPTEFLGNAVDFQSGSGADQLFARAFDGLAWSGWKAFTITAPINVAPVVVATDRAAAHGQALTAANLFAVTDAESDTITKYQVWDANGDAASGKWKINGVDQAANQAIDVSAANFANTTFQSGSGADQLFARAFDGLAWGNWKAFTVTAPVDAPPVVAAVNRDFAFNQSVAASTLFTVTDPEGDAITKYQFWDGNADAISGKFKVNGVDQAANQAIEVLAANLAQANFVAGSAAATDTLFVRAYDGTFWSPWKAFDVASHI